MLMFNESTGTDENTNAEIRDGFWKALAAGPTVMLALDASTHAAEPMRAQLDRDAHGAIWFFTSRDNRCAAGGAAHAQFVAKGQDQFASISGRLVEERDAAVLDRFWSNPIAAWYPQGRTDANLLVLRFELDSAEIWQPELGLTGGFKILTGMTLKPSEVGKHAVVGLG